MNHQSDLGLVFNNAIQNNHKTKSLKPFIVYQETIQGISPVKLGWQEALDYLNNDKIKLNDCLKALIFEMLQVVISKGDYQPNPEDLNIDLDIFSGSEVDKNDFMQYCFENATELLLNLGCAGQDSEFL